MKRRNEQAAPPYSEVQATAWLAWLARGMQQHGQTIFLIEQLQPSWLSTRRQRWVYILMSRLIWGVVIGLIYGLFAMAVQQFVVTVPLHEVALVGLASGAVGGLIGGLIALVGYDHDRSQSTSDSSLLYREIIWAHQPTTAWRIKLLPRQQAAFAKPRLKRSRQRVPSLWRILWIDLSASLYGWYRANVRRTSIGSILLFGLASVFVDVLMVELKGGTGGHSGSELIGALVGGLFFGLICGPFWALRSTGRRFEDDIRTIEAIRFSWACFRSKLKNGLIYGGGGGLVLGLIVGLFGGLGIEGSDGLSLGLVVGLAVGLVGGLIFGLFFGLMSCFRPGIRELKTIPNQGIRLSVRTGVMMGGIGGLGLGLTMGLFRRGWTGGLAFGVLGGLCIGLWYGGLDVIQHYIVRLLFWRAGAMSGITPASSTMPRKNSTSCRRWAAAISSSIAICSNTSPRWSCRVNLPPAISMMSLNRP